MQFTEPDRLTDPYAELYLAPKMISAMLIIFGILIIFVNSIQFDTQIRAGLMLLAFFLIATAAVAWALEERHASMSCWLLILTAVGMTYLSIGWFKNPALLVLLPIPIALTTALLGSKASVATAIAESALLILFWAMLEMMSGLPMLFMVVLSLWLMVGAMFAITQRSHEVARWALDNSHRVQAELGELRDQKGQLLQTQDDLVRVNREAKLLGDRLEAMRLAAEESQQAKVAFVGKVSHEFRTPLNMIIGLIDTLTENSQVYGQELPVALLRDLEIVRRNSDHLASMINDVLALSQAEAGQLVLHREWVDLSEDIESCTSLIEPLLAKKSLALDVDVQDLPRVYCDRTRIRQVILNLMSNAARYTQTGGITLHARVAERHVIVQVSDTGPGISAAEVEKIFEPFHQSSSNLWRDRDGVGLGLNISQQFINQHEGEIGCESKLGVGSTFTFKLPISPESAAIASQPSRWVSDDWVFFERRTWPSAPQSSYQERVVICDETGIMYTLLSNHAEHIEFIDAANLSQALQELDACPAHSLVLNASTFHELEPMMMAARVAAPDMPIIGFSLPPQIDRALDAGVMGYLTKPVRQEKLANAVSSLGMPINRILIVDDNTDVRELFSRMLLIHDDALEIITAADGVAALNVMRRTPLDLVLLDIVMADMDGWQILAQKEQDDTIRDIPVVITSAEDQITQTISSTMMMAAMGNGFSINQMLNCALHFPTLLLGPLQAPAPTPE